MERYTITDLARAFDVTLRTLRFYEDVGLLKPERRGMARLYSKQDKARLRFILRCKRLGMPLGELRALLELHDTARQDPQQTQALLEKLCARRIALEQQQEDIAAVLDELRFFDEQYRRPCKT